MWLLDWDGAVLAPRERDLMFVLGGVNPSALAGAQEQARFFEGYGVPGLVDVDPVRLAYYRCSWAVQDVADYAGRALDPRRPVEEREHVLQRLRSNLSPRGIVEQALTSLREIG